MLFSCDLLILLNLCLPEVIFRRRIDVIVLILSVVMASPSLDMAVMDDDSLRVSTIGWQL